MIEMLRLKSCKPIDLVSTPSTTTSPVGSTIRNRADMMDDLPAPVRPTIPTFSPLFTRQHRLFNTGLAEPSYTRDIFLSSISPLEGQSGGGRCVLSESNGASCGSL